jgi:hypothetical protein
MSWLSSAIGHALTPRGTSEANRDRARKAKPQEIAGSTLQTLSPLFGRQAQFALDTEGYRQNNIMDLLRMGTTGGLMENAESARRGFMGNALASSPYLRQAVSRGGAGIGAVQGAELSGINNATSKANDYLSWLLSPEGRMSISRVGLGASGFAMPALNDLNSLASIVYGRPAPAVGPSPLAGIANLGMQAFGMGAFGGGGGGVPFIGSGSSPVAM